MTLTETIEILRSELPTSARWKVYVLSRQDGVGNPVDEVIQFPIFDVSVDHEDSDVNLLTDDGATAPRPVDEALDVEELLARLESLEEECADYSLFSGSSEQSVSDEWEVRLDVPLVGVARNRESNVFGFLQHPREQWESEGDSVDPAERAAKGERIVQLVSTIPLVLILIGTVLGIVVSLDVIGTHGLNNPGLVARGISRSALGFAILFFKISVLVSLGKGSEVARWLAVGIFSWQALKILLAIAGPRELSFPLIVMVGTAVLWAIPAWLLVFSKDVREFYRMKRAGLLL